jgi:ABC-type transport system substrate-binding protein
LLNPDPEARFTSVETAFMALTTAQRDTVAIIDIGDTITIEKSFASGTGTTQLAQELSVEGIEHYLDLSSGHRVLISTAPTTIVYELILDNVTYGTLDALNVLG